MADIIQFEQARRPRLDAQIAAAAADRADALYELEAAEAVLHQAATQFREADRRLRWLKAEKKDPPGVFGSLLEE